MHNTLLLPLCDCEGSLLSRSCYPRRVESCCPLFNPPWKTEILCFACLSVSVQNRQPHIPEGACWSLHPSNTSVCCLTCKTKCALKMKGGREDFVILRIIQVCAFQDTSPETEQIIPVPLHVHTHCPPVPAASASRN